jgi:hypothetical protein
LLEEAAAGGWAFGHGLWRVVGTCGDGSSIPDCENAGGDWDGGVIQIGDRVGGEGNGAAGIGGWEAVVGGWGASYWGWVAAVCEFMCALSRSKGHARERRMIVNWDGGRTMRFGGVLALGVALLAGCASKEDQAVDAAKKQAAATGQAQQVVSVDKYGSTTTVTVQPPAAGQTAQAVTTVVTPAAGGAASGQTAVGGAPVPAPAQAPVQAVAGGPPVVRPADVNIPAGSQLEIRINQRISVKTTPAGSRFDGEVVEPWADANGRVILPKGTPVSGVVDASHRRGHFKGRSVLELRLTSLTLNGTRYPIETHDLMRTKKGKGKRSAAFIGGGTGLGMLIGGVASGGTGLLIGGLAGGGAGTAIGGLTGNRDLDIPAESIVRFRLAGDLVLQG